MRYSEVEPISRDEAEKAFASGISETVCAALIRVVYHEPDWRWVQGKCIEMSDNPDPAIAGLAITSLGHLARIRRRLELDKVLPVLEKHRADPIVGGRVEDALDDIAIYLSD